MAKRRRLICGFSFAVLILILCLIDLDRVPAPWWDEGWTLTVARTWVERGHYGMLKAGELAPPGLNAAFPVTGVVALSFKLLGVGLWQGRLPGVLYTLGAFAIMYFLAQMLYSRRIAIATLFVLLLTPIYRDLHPLIMGRQTLGEMPSLFFLLAGLLCYVMALRRNGWLVIFAGLSWGLAYQTKAQVQPFWLISVALPFVVAVFKRWRRAALLTLITALFTWLGIQVWSELTAILINGATLPSEPLTGLYQVTAVVLTPSVRLEAVRVVLLFGVPTVAGMIYAAWQFVQDVRHNEATPLLALGRASLFGLAGSWLAWFVALSVGWPRYFFPVVFLSSIFVAVLLARLTHDFDLRALGRDLRQRSFAVKAASAMLATYLALFPLLTILSFTQTFSLSDQTSAQRTAAWLNQNVKPNELIETYDTELFFLLNRPYHYPPDQVHVDLNRRTFLQEDVPIAYDPLAADPDYLVVGLFGRSWQLYEPVLRAGAFRLLQDADGYQIYQRVR